MSQRRWVLLIVGAVVVVVSQAQTVWAIPPFLKEFQAKYVKADASEDKDKEFAKLVNETAKCNVCHAAGQEKKVRNSYGAALGELLKKDNFKAERLKAEPEKCTAEIVAAFDAVAGKKSGDDKSPTYGELIAAGKLPGGEGKPAEAKPDTPEPKPNPTPAPATPAPAASAPSPEAQAAIAAIRKIGGSVMQLAQNDDSLVVDFHLGGTTLNDEGLAQLKLLPKVVQLDLKDTQVTDAGLAQLAGIASLNRLHLEKTKVTDAGLAHLKDLGNLEYLNVYGTGVTDAGLEHLKGLKNLKHLYVWQTQVTDAGIAKLKEAIPTVIIVK